LQKPFWIAKVVRASRRTLAEASVAEPPRGREATGTTDGSGVPSDERTAGWTYRGINRAANAAGNRGGAMRQTRTAVVPSDRAAKTDSSPVAHLIAVAERLGPDEVGVLALIATPEAH